MSIARMFYIFGFENIYLNEYSRKQKIMLQKESMYSFPTAM